jgi:hypothetical protein
MSPTLESSGMNGPHFGSPICDTYPRMQTDIFKVHEDKPVVCCITIRLELYNYFGRDNLKSSRETP